MSIKNKLIFTVITGLLSLATIITIVADNKAEDALIEAEFNKLNTVQVAKNGEITHYFNYLKGLLTSLAGQRGTQDAFLAFEDGFYKLTEELQLDIPFIKQNVISDLNTNYLNNVNYAVPSSPSKKQTLSYLPTNDNALIAQYIFITANNEKLGEKNNMTYNVQYDSTYMQAHKKYHESFNKFLQAYELYDIFMVDLKGNLIYTDFKEKDFATNLKNGVYSKTGIANVYKKALNMNEGAIAFDDFEPYEPSYNSVASFMATPIFIDGIKQGVMIFQMPVDKINSIMQFDGKYLEAGLGESGECYLVGSDYKMRSNSRFIKDIKDSVIQKLGSTIGVWEIKTKSTKAIIENKIKSGQWIISDYRGTRVLSVYNKIDLFGQGQWVIIAEINEEEALKNVGELKSIIISTSIIILFISLFILIYFVNLLVVEPLKSLEETTKNLAYGEGDLTDRLEIKGQDEIAKVSLNINHFIKKVQETIIQAKNTGDENLSVSKQLASLSVEISEKTKEESSIVSDIVSAGESIQSNLKESILNAKETKNKIDNTETALSGASTLMVTLTQNVIQRSKAEIELAEKLQNLNSDAQQVKGVLEVISDIADQTNLLALNAAIEASRAGEHGRGFAVVADEVRKLAEKTQKSLLEINATVSIIVQSIMDASDSISINATKIEKLSDDTVKVEDEIRSSVDALHESVTRVDNMVIGYIENNKDIEEMVTKVQNVNELSNENTLSVQEITSASEHLTVMTADLNILLNTYKS